MIDRPRRTVDRDRVDADALARLFAALSGEGERRDCADCEHRDACAVAGAEPCAAYAEQGEAL
jgi:hypothetical protein